MSIAAFYRTYVPFVRTYSYYSEGSPVEVQTPPTWVKINLQPFKQGIQLDVTQTGNIYKNWKTAYARTIPVYDLSGIPSGATMNGEYFYYNGQWFAVTADQDWTTAGRAPKHYKYLAIAQTGQGAITWPEPVPLGTLVDEFEAAVREIQQTSIVLTELLEE